MEERLDAMLKEQDRLVAEDAETRPFEKRIVPCLACGYHRAHEWNPFSESWNCRVCGQPWHDQKDYVDDLSWEGAPYMRDDYGAYLRRRVTKETGGDDGPEDHRQARG